MNTTMNPVMSDIPDFVQIDFGPVKDGGDDVTGAFRKLDRNFSDLGVRLSDQGDIGGRLSGLETTTGHLGNAAGKDIGTVAGTVAAGDDGRFLANAQAAASAQALAAAALPMSGRSLSIGLELASPLPPYIAAIESTNNSRNLALNITNGGNKYSPAVMSFLLEGVLRGYFGMDVDAAWKVGSGNSSYRIWHEGNTTVDSNNFIKKV